MALFALFSHLNPTTRRWASRTAFGAAALMACLEAGAASALSFNFSFSGNGTPNSPATVTGTIDGLVDNQNNQKTGLTATVTSATNSGSLPDILTIIANAGDGIDVSGGQVTDANIKFFGSNNILELSTYSANGIVNFYGDNSGNFGNGTTSTSSSVLVFTPVSSGSASVPGPCPSLAPVPPSAGVVA